MYNYREEDKKGKGEYDSEKGTGEYDSEQGKGEYDTVTFSQIVSYSPFP